MKSPNYCVISVAEYQSKSLPKNLELCRQLKTYVEDKVTNTLIYFGVFTTGNNAGALAYFEHYSTLRDFEQAFEIYQDSSHYQTLFNGERASIKSSNFIKEIPVPIYPDTTVWIRDFNYSYNEPMHNDYFWHDACNDYPVVGVT